MKSLFTFNTTWQTTCIIYWKSLQTSHRRRLLSIKTRHSEKLLNVVFWNWKQSTTTVKWINVTFKLKQPHFDFLTFGWLHSNQKVLTVINYLVGMEIWRTKLFSQFFTFFRFLAVLIAILFHFFVSWLLGDSMEFNGDSEVLCP